jgi:hypothetical protein
MSAGADNLLLPDSSTSLEILNIGENIEESLSVTLSSNTWFGESESVT